MCAMSNAHSHAVETAAQLIHERRHPAGYTQVCDSCRAIAVSRSNMPRHALPAVVVLPEHGETGRRRLYLFGADVRELFGADRPRLRTRIAVWAAARWLFDDAERRDSGNWRGLAHAFSRFYDDLDDAAWPARH